MFETFESWAPTPNTLAILREVGTVLKEYAALEIRLTLRQLYYRLVAADIIPNQPREYKRLGSVLASARLAGFVDWDAIEDRVRAPAKASDWPNVQELVNSAVEAYRLPRWQDQAYYLELWCEKDALRSVIEPITRELHVTLMINRGYSSISAMYDASKRFRAAMADGKRPVLLYLGDFDPSGEDMVRDVKTRLALLRGDGSSTVPKGGNPWPEFMDQHGDRLELEVTKIALTREQIAQYRPPPNVAKTTDSRHGAFAARHGLKSYEVDALPPQALIGLVRGAIREYMDMPKYLAWVKKENEQKQGLVKAAKKIKA